MEKIQNFITKIEEINDRYELSNSDLEDLSKEMLESKVTTPIMGRFSTGKSALINAVLGYAKKLLKEDILPETAIPTEIVYEEAEESIITV